MSKKKIGALLICATLAIGVVGGTFAWFTSSDSVTNVFKTGSVEDPNGNGPDAGIDVEENFPGDTNEDGEWDKPVVPGETMQKEVWVNSTADYDQFLRAKITKVWYDAAGNPVTHYYVIKNGAGEETLVHSNGSYTVPAGSSLVTSGILDYNKIQLELSTAVTAGPAQGNTWTNIGDLTSPETGYFYYDQILQEMGYDEAKENTAGETYTDSTAHLLAKVKLTTNGEADNYYKNLTFDVIINAEGVQASGGAAKDLGWNTTVPAGSIAGYQ